MRRTIILSGVLGALFAVVPGAFGQTDSYPSRTITILVPFPPGGSADTVIRPIAQRMADNMKATIVIDNRPGASGNVAALATKQAAPDGYTLFLSNMSVMAINPMLQPDLRFDPVKDFAPITPIISFPHVLIVPADSPAKSVAELAAHARSKPGGLSFASQGVGSGGQILGEMFRQRVGAAMVHVPYRGAGPGVTEVMAGRIDFFFTSYISTGEQAKAGKVRMIAIGGKKRTDAAPGIPTMAEVGYPGIEMDMWHGMVAPAGTPAPIVKRLNEEFIRAARSPDIARVVALQATDLMLMPPHDFSTMIAADAQRMSKVIRDAGIKLQ
jgi:tripartite-type tricarboxylate transporter receptor subunit TctC